MFSYALARRLETRGVTVNAYHPGITRTGLMKGSPTMVKLFVAALNLTGRTPERAARGLVELAMSPAFAASRASSSTTASRSRRRSSTTPRPKRGCGPRVRG